MNIDDQNVVSGIKQQTVFKYDSEYPFIKKWHAEKGNRFLMHCTICVNYQDTVKRHQTNRKPAPITTMAGTQHRKKTIDDHVKTPYHEACVLRKKREAIKNPCIADSNTTLTKMISAQNAKMACLVGKYMRVIYNDAKRLTLSAWSWPSRMVTQELAAAYDINDRQKNEDAKKNLNLQYINPKSHWEFLNCIIESESNLITKQIDECRAISLRVDGSVDRTQIDKIYILGKLVDTNGNYKTLFLGVGQQTERGAAGLHKTIQETLDKHGAGCYIKCLRKMSSIVTDGASINIGEHNGLWRLIDDDAKRNGAAQNILKIWCAAHRSDLTVKDLNKSVEEVPIIIHRLTSLASFIRRSHIRMDMLKKTAVTNGFRLLNLPKTYQVRWAEFTSSLINAVLISWQCLVTFLGEYARINEKQDDGFEAEAHRRFLTDIETLEMLAFLGDIYMIITIFQKKMQSNDLNIIDLKQHVDDTTAKLNDLREHSVIDGWEENLTEQLDAVSENDKTLLKGIELNRGQANRINAPRVCDSNNKKTFAALRRTVLIRVIESLSCRFSSDDDLCTILRPFISFDRVACSANNIRKIHALLALDIDLGLLSSQFDDICRNETFKRMTTRDLIKHLAVNDPTSSFLELLTVLARFVAATPHSADVERTISANNLLKTDRRTSLKLETENNYLFVHFNMPPVLSWEPERAVVHWINAKQRRVHNLVAETETRKSKKRKYFNGVFHCIDTEDTDDEVDTENDSVNFEPPKRKKRCF